MMSLIPLIALAVASPGAPADDQTPDALLVLEFIQAVRQKDKGRADSMLSKDAFLGDYAQRRRRSYEEFAAYARACQLRRISLVNVRDGSRMPIGVEWQCRNPEADRKASFWFKGDQISRIAWGTPPVIQVPKPHKQQ